MNRLEGDGGRSWRLIMIRSDWNWNLLDILDDSPERAQGHAFACVHLFAPFFLDGIPPHPWEFFH